MARKLTWTEVFYSIQGEGPRMGCPSVFVRMFGCNLRCAGFGMPAGTGMLSEERMLIDPSMYEKVQDIPVTHTGCDEWTSWDERCRHLTRSGSADDIMDEIFALFDQQQTDVPLAIRMHKTDIVMTGGEPLLPAWQKGYQPLFERLSMHGTYRIAFETNGTQPLTEEMERTIEKLSEGFSMEFLFVISPKIPTETGESWGDAVRPEAIHSIMSNDWTDVAFKFVVSERESEIRVKEILDMYKLEQYTEKVEPMVYVMPVGASEDGQSLNRRLTADMALRNGWSYSPRLHIDLYRGKRGT